MPDSPNLPMTVFQLVSGHPMTDRISRQHPPPFEVHLIDADDGEWSLMSGCPNLTNYVTEAMRIGAHVLSVIGQAQEAHALERMLKEVGEKTADSMTRAAELTEQAVREASDTMTKAPYDNKIAITAADTHNRKKFATAMAAAEQNMNADLRLGDA